MTAPISAARFISPAQAAEQLGVSLRTIYELLNSGELESIKLPGGKTAPRRIEVASIEAFIKRSRVVPTGAATP